MGWFKKPSKEVLQGYKRIRVNGMRFTIRKVNPLVDFSADKIPQIFADYVSRRQLPVSIEKAQKEMYAMIEAGVIEPKLFPIGIGENRGKEGGLTVEDLFRDFEMGQKLYLAILDHSLNRFKGIRKLFFSIKTKYLFWIALQKGMANLRQELHSAENSP